MTTPAAAPATATPPAAALDDAAQAAADEKELPPLDHDAEIKDQIERAKEVAAREERKKARAEKGKKGKTAPKPAPEPEAKAEPETPPEAEQAEPEAEQDEAPRGMGTMLVEARKKLAAGDLDGALELAFGKKSDAFRVNSARWAEFRKANTAASRQMAEREQKLEHGIRQVEQKFGPLVKAKKAFDSGDYKEALQQAFGIDPETFNKKLLAQFHGKHPDVERLERQLRERDEAEARRKRELEEQGRHEQERQQHARNLELIGQHLGQHEDEAIVELSKRPRFRARVLQILSEHYDTRSKTSIPLEEAAEMVKSEIEAEFGSVFRPRSVSESPTRAGTKHARPATTLSQRGAAEASPPGRALTDEELYRKYSNLAKSATG